MNTEHYTNCEQLYFQLKLDQHNCALWHMHWPDSKINLLNQDITKFITSQPSWQTADKIFVIGQETGVVDLVNLDPRIHVWEPAIQIAHPRIHQYQSWFSLCKFVNLKINSLAHLTNPLTSTPTYMFDALLGWLKPHRNCVEKFVDSHNLHDKIILSYFGRDKKWLAGTEFDDLKHTTFSPFRQTDISYGNWNALPGHVIPYNIYNNSWFTIVTESEPRTKILSNQPLKTQNLFVSEKTAKPLLSKRLFVFFGCAGFLAGLRQLGFETFSSVIDESYDQILDDQTRWATALAEVQKLLQQDPAVIYQKILPILEHNQRLILDTDWDSQFWQSMVTVSQS